MVAKVVVINDASVARGGATGLACLSMQMLRKRGIEVTAFVGDTGENPDFSNAGIEVVALGNKELVKTSKLEAATRGIYNEAAKDALQNWIHHNDEADVVYHVHGWSKILSPSIFEALRPVAKRTVIHAHDFFLACPNGAFMDYQKFQPCERTPLSFSCVVKHCDKRSYHQKLWRVVRQIRLSMCLDKTAQWGKILMIHEKMAPYLQSAGYPEVLLRTVKNPAERFTSVRVRAEENKEFVFVGRVEAEKGILELIEAAEIANVPLKVIGEGPLREELTEKYPHVDFLGWKSRGEIADAIVSARALVMPSRYPEPFGLVVAEASASGLPVLLSRSAFLSHEVENWDLGFSFDGRDPQTIAKTLKTMRDLQSDLIKQMSETGYSRKFTLANTPDDWLNELVSSYEATLN